MNFFLQNSPVKLPSIKKKCPGNQKNGIFFRRRGEKCRIFWPGDPSWLSTSALADSLRGPVTIHGGGGSGLEMGTWSRPFVRPHGGTLAWRASSSEVRADIPCRLLSASQVLEQECAQGQGGDQERHACEAGAPVEVAVAESTTATVAGTAAMAMAPTMEMTPVGRMSLRFFEFGLCRLIRGIPEVPQVRRAVSTWEKAYPSRARERQHFRLRRGFRCRCGSAA